MHAFLVLSRARLHAADMDKTTREWREARRQVRELLRHCFEVVAKENARRAMECTLWAKSL